ncbi:hypothetical protein HanRHA438_Chr00c75g0862711 [Helianthus annuus]|nr:hypothetical protein HanRHA438_Chr00c75g0862711 [Helianthus annuus]
MVWFVKFVVCCVFEANILFASGYTVKRCSLDYGFYVLFLSFTVDPVVLAFRDLLLQSGVIL